MSGPSRAILGVAARTRVFVASFITSPARHAGTPAKSRDMGKVSLLPFSSTTLSCETVRGVPMGGSTRAISVCGDAPTLALPDVSRPAIPVAGTKPTFVRGERTLYTSFSIVTFFLDGSCIVFTPVKGPPVYSVVVAKTGAPKDLGDFSRALSGNFPTTSPEPRHEEGRTAIVGKGESNAAISTTGDVPLLAPSRRVSNLMGGGERAGTIGVAKAVCFQRYFLSVLFALFHGLGV